MTNDSYTNTHTHDNAFLHNTRHREEMERDDNKDEKEIKGKYILIIHSRT